MIAQEIGNDRDSKRRLTQMICVMQKPACSRVIRLHEVGALFLSLALPSATSDNPQPTSAGVASGSIESPIKEQEPEAWA